MIAQLADDIEKEQSQEIFDKDIVLEDFTKDEKIKAGISKIIE